jgi:hypothetical protein
MFCHPARSVKGPDAVEGRQQQDVSVRSARLHAAAVTARERGGRRPGRPAPPRARSPQTCPPGVVPVIMMLGHAADQLTAIGGEVPMRLLQQPLGSSTTIAVHDHAAYLVGDGDKGEPFDPAQRPSRSAEPRCRR